MTSPFALPLDPASPPDPVTPYGGVSDVAGYSKVTPPGTGPAPAPYDIAAPQDIAGIAAAVEAAGRLSGGQEGAATGAGHLYPPGPRQAEAHALLMSPQGSPEMSVLSGFPDYESADVSPGANLETPIQGQVFTYPVANTYQPGIPQFTAGLGSGASAGVAGVSPDSGAMVPSKGMDYPGTLQDGLTKYGTS